MDSKVPLLDLKAQWATLEAAVWPALEAVVRSQQFILGPEVEAFETELAAYCGSRFAIGCASGTDALLLSLTALGGGPGDEVITTPYTFFATVGAIARAGARPVLVDIDPSTFNIDPAAAVAAITPRTVAIVPVHLFGRPADVQPLLEAAARHGLAILEDACQAIGAEWNGRRVGSLGTLAAFSFFPTKNLGGFGDGGAVTTDVENLARQIRALRVHGSEERYRHRVLGWNSRLDALQAAVLRVKLSYLERWTEARRRNARRYQELFESYGLTDIVRLPSFGPPEVRHVFNQFVVRVPADHRDSLREALRQAGVGTEVYYPVPAHLQEAAARWGYRPGQFPEAELAARESLALPIYPELTEGQQRYVVRSIASYFGRT
jgi:dTDP-4-amino-4,6-dideoxygalactose transaminase